MPNDYQHLIKQLNSQKVVAFVGAGVSATYRDPKTQRVYKGLSTASELVKEMAIGRKYITQKTPFEEACFLLKENEDRSSLISLLQTNLDIPNFKPLPAHNVLALLPFCAYITTNYDRLLEKALSSYRKNHHIVIEDYDVSLLRQSFVPLIKVHGCFSRPFTIVASADEESSFFQRAPIIDSFLRTILANRTVLFLGFGLQDRDFRELYQQMKAALGEMMPRSYAVANTPTEFQTRFWDRNGVTIIEDDLTEFLRKLLFQYEEEPAEDGPEGDWLPPFLGALRGIRNIPSETQVINVFIDKVFEELQSAETDVSNLALEARKATTVFMSRRTHFGAFRKSAEEIIEKLRDCEDATEAQASLMDYQAVRTMISTKIDARGRNFLRANERVLLYSQSIRVVEILRGVPEGIQSTCSLFIGECRPKSPSYFQDAFSTVDHLTMEDPHRSNAYSFTIVPDGVAGILISKREVDRVIMGAHTVFVDKEGNPDSFVNTAGSAIISSLCREFGIPLFLVAESAKEELVTEKDVISYGQEEDLSSTVKDELKKYASEGLNVVIGNVGYDLVPSHEGITYISER